MLYTPEIVAAQVIVPQRVRAYDDPFAGRVELIENIFVKDVPSGITFIQGAAKVSGATTKPNGVWLNIGMTYFAYQGAKTSIYAGSFHFLTPIISDGALRLRNHWVSPYRPGSNTVEVSGPYTVDLKLVLGGFN
jgi:hypothetical protein